MKKALMYASVVSMIEMFNLNNIKILQNNGFDVEVACNFSYGDNITEEKIAIFKKYLEEQGIKYYDIPIPRDIKKIKKIHESIKITKQLANQNKYDLVHCHTPIGGAICRIAFKQTETRVLYTAHGFHFYKGAPLINWLVFYPIERILSCYTDDLITINKEDYLYAKQFYAKRVHYVPGVGISVSKIDSLTNNTAVIKSNKNNYSLFKIISVGELNKNKNQEVIIKALNILDNPNIIYYICGVGDTKEYLESLVKKFSLENQVVFLGYRNDIIELLKASDLFVFPSFREGLSVSLMEAKAVGLPAVVSDIRGNRDLITEKVDGFLVKADDYNSFAKKILNLYEDRELRKNMSENTRKSIKKFSDANVNHIMNKIYRISN